MVQATRDGSELSQQLVAYTVNASGVSGRTVVVCMCDLGLQEPQRQTQERRRLCHAGAAAATALVAKQTTIVGSANVSVSRCV